MSKDLKLLVQIWLSEEMHEETERLLERLKDDEAFRLAFVDEIMIMGKVKAVNLAEPKFVLLEEILNDQPENSKQYEEKIFQSLEREDRRKKVIKFMLALVAAIAIIASLNLLKEKDKTTVVVSTPMEIEEAVHTIAIISSQNNAKWADDKFESHKNLNKEELHLLEGTARVDFIFGASLVMNAGAKITIEDEDKIFLHEGRVTCEVNEFGKGFIINTDKSEIVDLGTAFQVEAGKGKDTKIHVLEGEVKVRPNNAKLSKSFYKSEAVSVSNNNLNEIKFSSESLFTIDEYEEALELQRNEKYKLWLENNKKIATNSDTVFHLVKSEKPLNQLKQDISGTELQAVYTFGCSNERGRWLKNGALSYTKKYDRTLVRLKNERKNFTLTAWVKFDNLNSEQNALMFFEMPGRWMSSIGDSKRGKRNDTSLGAFHAMRWMVTKGGRPSLRMGYYGEKPVAGLLKWHTFQVPKKIISHNSMGNWLFLAVTVDSENLRVNHYFNGRRVAIENMDEELSAKLEFLEIGNLSRPGKNEDKGMAIRLNGSIDELMVKGVALTPEEIKELYSIGKP